MTKDRADQYETVSDKNPATEAFVFPVEDKSKEQDPQGQRAQHEANDNDRAVCEGKIPEKLRDACGQSAEERDL